MKHNKYWSKGAVVGLLISVILWIAYIIYLQHGFGSSLLMYISEKVFRNIFFISVIGWRSILLYFPYLTMAEFFVFPSISLTVYGAIVGWIYGKINPKLFSPDVNQV